MEVRRGDENVLSVEVEEDYQRRGVATRLIKQAQEDHDYLSLVNLAGAVGEKLYMQLGFRKVDDLDHFVWKKEENQS